MALPRKKKPGPKRRTGRPATAQARATNTAYQKAQREALKEVGFVVIQVVVPASESAHMRRKSQVHRLEGLIAVARAAGDEAEAQRQQYRLAALRIDHEAEVRAETDQRNRAIAEARREAEASRREREAKTARPQGKRPDWMV